MITIRIKIIIWYNYEWCTISLRIWIIMWTMYNIWMCDIYELIINVWSKINDQWYGNQLWVQCAPIEYNVYVKERIN